MRFRYPADSKRLSVCTGRDPLPVIANAGLFDDGGKYSLLTFEAHRWAVSFYVGGNNARRLDQAMIHELLLSLSGHPSPLLRFPHDASLASSESSNIGVVGPDLDLRSALSPAEIALLSSLATDLGAQYSQISQIATQVLNAHKSNVCRAVASRLLHKHSGDFQKQILQLEKEILEGGSGITGANGQVPLSAIVSRLDGWGRRFGWLLGLARVMQEPGETKSSRDPGNASELIDYLRSHLKTGFPDLRDMCQDLVAIAEGAWMKQLAAWVLYGRLTDEGDFFVRRKAEDADKPQSSLDQFETAMHMAPNFVSAEAAESVLFIGKSLHHIRERQKTNRLDQESVFTTASPELESLLVHLELLSSLNSPINGFAFVKTINDIRLSLSQNALQKLLPMSRVLDLLHILRDFFLLERGEFAYALIAAAEDRLVSRSHIGRPRKTAAGLGSDFANLTINEGEVHSVIARTWTALSSLRQYDGDEADDELDRVRSLIRLSLNSVRTTHAESQSGLAPSFDDLLLPSPTSLTLRVPEPLDLVLTPSDISIYSSINAYLLAIGRAQIRLNNLFLLSRLRRGRQPAQSLRLIWATVSSTSTFLSEVGTYLHGEVIPNSWTAFYSYLCASRPSSSSSSISLQTLQVAATEANEQRQHDPQSLSQAHGRYIQALYSSILLSDTSFTIPLRKLMSTIELVVGLMRRLGVVYQTASSSVSIPTAGISKEVDDLVAQATAAVRTMSGQVEMCKEILRTIAEAEDRSSSRPGKEMETMWTENSLDGGAGFVPWVPGRRGLERLVGRFW